MNPAGPLTRNPYYHRDGSNADFFNTIGAKLPFERMLKTGRNGEAGASVRRSMWDSNLTPFVA
jgi:hypothetical protein